MLTTPEEVLNRFASRLSCEYEVGSHPTPLASSASTLPHLLSSAPQGVCTFSSLSLKTRARGSESIGSKNSNSADNNCTVKKTETASSLQSAMAEAESLGRTVRIGRHNVAMAPGLLLRNVLCSFGHIVHRRMHRSLCHFAELSSESQLRDEQHPNGECCSKKNGKKQKRLANLCRKFSSSSVITPVAAAIRFDPVYEHFVNCEQKGGQRRCQRQSCDTTNYDSVQHMRVPVNFHASVDLQILEKEVVTVFFGSPATIKGVFAGAGNRPESVHVRVDTAALLESMKKECQDVVDKAVAKIDQDVRKEQNRPRVDSSFEKTRKTSDTRKTSRTLSTPSLNSERPKLEVEKIKSKPRRASSAPSLPAKTKYAEFVFKPSRSRDVSISPKTEKKKNSRVQLAPAKDMPISPKVEKRKSRRVQLTATKE